MKYKRAIGIDPGNSGAIAFIYGKPEDLIIFDMPVVKEKNISYNTTIGDDIPLCI